MITVAEAESLVLRAARPFPTQRKELEQALGCVLRENVLADRAWPPYDRVAMDGIAVDGASLAQGTRRFHIEDIQPAGRPPLTLHDPASSCIEVMTGAVLPAGTDTVIPVEETVQESGAVALRADARPVRGAFVHRCGSDRRAGDLLLSEGTRLGFNHLALLAAADRFHVRVAAPPAVTILATGDELVQAGAPMAPHQIRPSNLHGLSAALRALGAREVATAVLPDDPAALRAGIAEALASRGLLLLSGGVSRGAFDHVPGILAKLGVNAVFHGVAQKPGKPLWFGIAPQGCAVFALPGNPVSALTCFRRYVVPWWQQSAGETHRPVEQLPLVTTTPASATLTYFLPAKVEPGPAGLAVAAVLPYGGSGDLAALGSSDGFIEVPTAETPLAVGTPVRFFRWQP